MLRFFVYKSPSYQSYKFVELVMRYKLDDLREYEFTPIYNPDAWKRQD